MRKRHKNCLKLNVRKLMPGSLVETSSYFKSQCLLGGGGGYFISFRPDRIKAFTNNHAVITFVCECFFYNNASKNRLKITGEINITFKQCRIYIFIPTLNYQRRATLLSNNERYIFFFLLTLNYLCTCCCMYSIFIFIIMGSNSRHMSCSGTPCIQHEHCW